MRIKAILLAALTALGAAGCSAGESGGSEGAAVYTTAAGSEVSEAETTAAADTAAADDTSAAADDTSAAVTTTEAAVTTVTAETTAAETEPSSAYENISDMDRVCYLAGKLSGSGLVTKGENELPSEAVGAVEAAVDSIEAAGHRVSFIMIDPALMSGAAYDAGSEYCVQSVIKSVYIGALADAEPDAVYDSGELIRDAVAYSLNDAYQELRDTYGCEHLRRWCEQAGISGDIADTDYPVMTPAEMIKLWGRLYTFFGTDAGAELSQVYQNTIGSAAGQLYGGSIKVLSKAGWECGADDDAVSYDPDEPVPEYLTDGDPYNDECAANDAGIVYAPSGTYLYVIFSDIPFGVFEENTPDNPLTELTAALYRLHEEMDRQ